MVEMDKYEVG